VFKSQETRRRFLADQSLLIRLVYLPKQTLWLNQIEIVFGVVMGKVIRRGNFPWRTDLSSKLRHVSDYFKAVFAKPFRASFSGRPLQTQAT
jgi:hypothetical protein